MSNQTISINFSALASTGRLENGCWMGYLEPLGVAVYGDTRDEVRAQLRSALDFFEAAINDLPDPFENAKAYLSCHAIDYSVSFDERPIGHPMSSSLAGLHATSIRGKAMVHA